MATRNVVPRSNHEGQLGREDKYWNKAYIDEIHAQKVVSDATGDPTSNDEFVTKEYVDNAVSQGAGALGNVAKLDKANAFTAENEFNNTTTLHNTVAANDSTINLTAAGVVGVPTPTASAHATNKLYVDNGLKQKASLTGTNVFTGQNTFNSAVHVGTPTAASHAATKQYVDEQMGGEPIDTSNLAKLDGTNTFTGDNNFNQYLDIAEEGYLRIYGTIQAMTDGSPLGSSVVNFQNAQSVTIPEPIADNSAATKKYVDDAVSNVDVDTSNLAKLTNDNTFHANNTFNSHVTFSGLVEGTSGCDIDFSEVGSILVPNPTGDNHPATKKYVDDKTVPLGGISDITNLNSSTEMEFSDSLFKCFLSNGTITIGKNLGFPTDLSDEGTACHVYLVSLKLGYGNSLNHQYEQTLSAYNVDYKLIGLYKRMVDYGTPITGDEQFPWVNINSGGGSSSEFTYRNAIDDLNSFEYCQNNSKYLYVGNLPTNRPYTETNGCMVENDVVVLGDTFFIKQRCTENAGNREWVRSGTATRNGTFTAQWIQVAPVDVPVTVSGNTLSWGDVSLGIEE